MTIQNASKKSLLTQQPPLIFFNSPFDPVLNRLKPKEYYGDPEPWPKFSRDIEVTSLIKVISTKIHSENFVKVFFQN